MGNSDKKKGTRGRKAKKSAGPSRGFKKTRVAAKKTSVRAPAVDVKPLKNTVEEAIAEQEQELDQVSLASLSVGSLESLDEKEIVETRGRGRPRMPRATGEAKVAKGASKRTTRAKKTTTAGSSEPAEPKKRGGRPKRSRSPPASPRRSSPGRAARVVHPFLGGQRLAAIAKETFINNVTAQAIVVEKAVFEVGKQRRKRVDWSDSEIESLQNGVRIHGESAWSAILNDSVLKFHPHRTQVDLKDKWRNLTSYKTYQEHPIRRFALVDSRHEEIVTSSGNAHILNNRWPRDAALKMSTKDWIYPVDENGNRADSVLIHLKEVMNAQGRSWRPQVVHVYRVTRILQKPRDILKFNNYAAVWGGKVDKIAEEMLIKSDEILSAEDLQKRGGAGSSSSKSPISPSETTLDDYNLEL